MDLHRKLEFRTIRLLLGLMVELVEQPRAKKTPQFLLTFCGDLEDKNKYAD